MRNRTFAGELRVRHKKANDFSLYYKVTAIRTVWYWDKDQRIDQWDRIKFRKKSMHLWSIIYNKACKNIQCRKDNLFKWYGGKWTVTHEIGTFCNTIHKNKLKLN